MISSENSAGQYREVRRRSTVKDMLERLVNLQATDEKIVSFQREEAKIPEELRTKEKGIETFDKQRAEIEAERDLFLGQVSELAKQLEEAKESTRRFQTRLLVVKTQREYQAVQREGESARKKREDLESELKEIQQEKDAVEESLKEIESTIAKETAALNEERKKSQSRLKSVKEEREDLEKTREVEASLIEPDLLARYQKVFNRYRGQGVVKVVGGVCYGCFMTVPPQLYNQVLAQGTVHQCPNCGRIIYVDES